MACVGLLHDQFPAQLAFVAARRTERSYQRDCLYRNRQYWVWLIVSAKATENPQVQPTVLYFFNLGGDVLEREGLNFPNV